VAGLEYGADLHGNPIRRDSNGFYQGDLKIGSAMGPSLNGQVGTIQFQGVRLSEYPDFSKPIEYGDLLLSAEGLPAPRPNGFVGTLSITMAGFQTKILGKR
jgi:hypothetical protein